MRNYKLINFYYSKQNITLTKRKHANYENTFRLEAEQLTIIFLKPRHWVTLSSAESKVSNFTL